MKDAFGWGKKEAEYLNMKINKRRCEIGLILSSVVSKVPRGTNCNSQQESILQRAHVILPEPEEDGKDIDSS